MNDGYLERLERAAYRSHFADGLADVAIGAFIWSIGYARMTDVDIAPGIVGALMAPLWIAARRWLVEPRAGSAVLSDRRMAGLRGRILVLAIGLAVALVLGFLSFRAIGADPVALPGGAVLLPLVVGVLIAGMGVLFDFPRLIAYGALLPLAKILGDTMAVPRGRVLMALGMIVVAVGLLLLARFLRANPRPSAGADDVL